MTTNNNLLTAVSSRKLGNVSKALYHLVGVSVGTAWIVCLAIAAAMAIVIALCVLLYSTVSKASDRE